MSKALRLITLLMITLLTTTIILAACALPAASPTAGPAAELSSLPAGDAADQASDPALLPAERPPGHLIYSDWRTDFDRRVVEWEEILSGGPPKDGIPAIDEPQFESVEAAATWLSERDPVILFMHGAVARAYPLAILIWHEIVNDTVGSKPVAVTFCPLCNASIVFDRTFEGEVLDFGTTGLLRNSDLIMYDRQSESWWQQFTGQAIVGRWAGRRLDFLPSQVIAFGDFAAAYPGGEVLARPAISRSYGANPYTGYDSLAERPFLFTGELDQRLPATERVVGIAAAGEVMAYPFTAVAAAGAINDVLGKDGAGEDEGLPIVVFHKPGMASALDSRTISEGRDVGSIAVFERRVAGRTLTFRAAGDGTFTDAETGSAWTLLGQAIDGPLAGQALPQLLAFDHFWFAWAAFHPTTQVYGLD
ncbi:MAG TPA: DUF3179 domain-containing protein [Caldilineaceae bacterium]|nr:DUF3179 domain-containing protein [Caldilineaceae bacterium]